MKYYDNDRIGTTILNQNYGGIVMKKHSIKFLMIVLILVLSLSTVILAACNKDGDDKKPAEEPNYNVATGEMLSSIVENIGSSINFGESFGLDVAGAFVIDDKTSANKDVTYKLTAKGNANGKSDASETDTNFVVELTKEQGQTKEVLLGIAYESIENEPYFFINLMESGYKKINGYSMASLYKMTQKSATAQADEGGFDIASLLPTLLPIFFGDEGTVIDNVYTLNFDLSSTVSKIIGMKQVILLALGMEESDLNALIAQYLGGLSYEQNGKTVNVKDLATLDAFFKRGMSFGGSLVFTFDGNDKFVNASASFDYAYHKEDKANYTLKVDKCNIGKVATPVDSFADFALSADERKSAQSVNLVNFSLNGSAVGYDAKGKEAHRYTIEVQSDIDAFQLLNLLNGTDKNNILATLKKLGYFHLEINEVYEDGKDPLNIITLHSKFDEGFAVVNVHAYSAVFYQVGLGGVYDFDALIDVIGMLGEGGEDEPSEPEQSIMEKLENIIDTVKDVLGYFTFENMKEDGVTVALKDLVFMICGMFGIDTSGLTGTGLSAIVGCNTMNVKLATPTFGTCTQVETDTVECGIRTASALSAGKTDFIKEIKSLDGFSSKMLQNVSDFTKFAQDVKLGKAFEITGVNLKGEEVKTSGFVMGAKGLDVSKAGKQSVTLYIAIANDMLDFSRAGFSFGDLIPLSGTLKFETEIEVIAFDKDAEVSVTNIKTDDQKVLAGDKAVFNIIRTGTSAVTEMTIGAIGTYTVDASMVRIYDAQTGGNDVTDTVLDGDGKFVAVGEYYARLVFGGYVANCCKITVEDAYAVRADGKAEIESLSLGGVWTFDAYKVYAMDKDGKSTQADIQPQYRIGSTTLSSLEDAFDIDGNNYTLKKNLDYVGKDFTIRFNNVITASGLKKTVEVKIPIVSDYTIEAKWNLTVYFGEAVSGKTQIRINDVLYTVVYKNSKWVAVAENGTEKSIEMTFVWDGTQTAVEFDQNGLITNYPNANKAGSRSTKVNYTLAVDGYTYTYYFNAYELYASDKKNAKVGDTLNGLISYVNKIAYEDAEGEAQELEFKYGANGYAIYVKDTDTKVYDVTVKVTKDGGDYTLTDGAFTETGTYKVEYSMTVNGVDQTFFHNVTVK